MQLKAIRRLAFLVAVVIPAACSDVTAGCLLFCSSPLESVGIGAFDGTVVETGDTLRLIASGKYAGRTDWNYAPILEAVWSTSDPTVARLETAPPRQDSIPQASTLVRGARLGTANIRASYDGITGEMSVRVIPVVGSIRLSPPSKITVGDTVRIAAATLDPGGKEMTGVPLSFGLTGEARFNGYDSTGANVIATAAGTATLSARFRRVKTDVIFVVLPKTP